MAEPTFEDVGTWLRDNPDKEGTSDYVHMSNAYRALHPDRPSVPPPPPGSAKSFSEDLWGRAKLALGINATDRSVSDWWNSKAAPEPKPVPGSENVPSLDDLMTAKRLTSDPRSLDNRGTRVVAGAIGGIPDLVIGGYNAAARTIGAPKSQAEYVTPKMLENSGTPDLPADAPWYERMGEAAGSAVLGGGAGAATGPLQAARVTAATTGKAIPIASTAARMAAPTAIPVVASTVGGEAGGRIGKYLGDEETGRYLGSLLGGSVLAAKPAAQSIIHHLYAGEGAANAAEVAAQAARQGVTPTAGMLGNDKILAREQRYSGMPGSADVVQQARTNARTGIGDAYDRAAVARGSTSVEPTPGTIGYDIANVARRGAADANDRSSQGQQQLMTDIGPRSNIDAGPTIRAGRDILGRTDPTTTGAPVEARLASIQRMIRENPANFDADGNQIAANIPYERWKDTRTNLREKGEGFGPVTGLHAGDLYDSMTAAMRRTAANSGVSPDVFDTVQGRTARLTGEGGPVQTLEPISDSAHPMPAYNFLRQGEQAPGNIRTLINTGISDVPRALGDYMRMIGNDTINKPGARGPANLAGHWGRMTPEARDAIAGPQLGNVSDVVGLSKALDIPSGPGGHTRSVGGQTDAVANKVIGSEALGQLGSYIAGPIGAMLGRILGVFGPSGYRGQKASVLEGPTARNALAGGQGPAGINNLGAALAAIQAENQQNRPVR